MNDFNNIITKEKNSIDFIINNFLYDQVVIGFFSWKGQSLFEEKKLLITDKDYKQYVSGNRLLING